MLSDQERVVITGMGVQTPLGDELDTFYDNLLAGRSAITRWRFLQRDDVYSKIGGDLSDYDHTSRLALFERELPAEVHARLRRLLKKAPFATRFSLLVAADAWRDAGLANTGVDGTRCATLVGGHNLNERYLLREHHVFQDEPDYIDAHAALLLLDTDHASSVSEALGLYGASYTVGGACASAGVALRSAFDEIRVHGHDVAVVVGAMLDYSELGLQGMAILGAIAIESFNDDPSRASRPYDRRREGFVPCHGAGALVLESLAHARRRGARIYAELLGAVATNDGCHLPSPSTEGQARTMRRLLEVTGTAPEEVGFVSAHATSTPVGDISELRAISQAFGDHAGRLRINAPKSMLGHCCWSAPAVETIAGILQLQGRRLHGSINIDELDDAVELDVCADGPVEYDGPLMMKNSFGFGGINCSTLIRRWEGGRS